MVQYNYILTIKAIVKAVHGKYSNISNISTTGMSINTVSEC